MRSVSPVPSPTGRRRATTAVAAAALACLLTPAVADAATGVVTVNPGYTLGAHSAPSTTAPKTRRLANGTRVRIVCQVRGTRVTGRFGTSRLWDKLAAGDYVSDTYVQTGSDGRVAPPCGGDTPPPPPPPPAPAADAFHYDDPGAWRGPSSCSGTFTPGAQALRTWLKANYAYTRSIGGYSCRPNTANTSQLSLHAEGRALDWMAAAGKPAQARAVNRFIARVSRDNWRLGRAMGIQELIWNRRIWTATYASSGFRRYTGPNPHVDHIHIGINRAGAAKRTSFYR